MKSRRSFLLIAEKSALWIPEAAESTPNVGITLLLVSFS